MNKLAMAIASSLALIALSGCATTGLYSRTGFALIQSSNEPVAATGAAGMSKVGKSCASNILGLFVSGDSGIDAARRAGGIKTISTVDVSTSNILSIYGQVCTTVHGD